MHTGLLGRMHWYELMTSSSRAAQGFYPPITGWGTQPFEGMDPPYTLWMRGEVPVGGVMDLTGGLVRDQVQPHWVMYVSTPDVLRTCRHAESLGARVLRAPTMIPDVGRFSVMADPQGAAFCLMQPQRPPQSPGALPELGDVSWHELSTSDDAAAFAFYTTLLGWESAGDHDMGPMGRYRQVGRHGREFGAIFRTPSGVEAPPHWLLYFRVPDVQAAAAMVIARGGRVCHGPTEVPGGDQTVQCVDPQGAVFALHQKG